MLKVEIFLFLSNCFFIVPRIRGYCEWRSSPISDMACQIHPAVALLTTVLSAIHYIPSTLKEHKKQCGAHICYIGGPISTTHSIQSALFHNMAFEENHSCEGTHINSFTQKLQICQLSGISMKYLCRKYWLKMQWLLMALKMTTNCENM